MGKLAHFLFRKPFQKIGMGLLSLIMALSILPVESHAFNLFNGEGNDGYSTAAVRSSSTKNS